MNFNGLDQDELKNLLNDRSIIMGEQTKSKIKEEYSLDTATYLNRVAIKRPTDLKPDELLPKSSNNEFTDNMPKVERMMIGNRINLLENKPIIEQPDFVMPKNSNWEYENKIEKTNLITEDMSIGSTKIPKSILKKPVLEKKIEKVEIIEQPKVKLPVKIRQVEEVDIERIMMILRKYNIGITREKLEMRIGRSNISENGGVGKMIKEIVSEYRPKKIERRVEAIKVFNEMDYYREKIRVCVSSDMRDIGRYNEPNNFEVNLPNNGLTNVSNIRLISVIMPKNIEEKLDELPYIILDIREFGQNFVMSNGKLGGFCQVIFDRENTNYKIAYPDSSLATKELNPIRNINKLTIRLMRPNGELIKFGNEEESIKLEIEETKPKINLPEYSPDPTVDIKKIEEIKPTESNILMNDRYPPISLLFEMTYLKSRSLMT